MIRNKNYPYELCSIKNRYYSHCIVNYQDKIIAYQDKKTDEWHSTDYWLECYPHTMEIDFAFGDFTRTIPMDVVRELIPEDELFLEMI